MKRDFLKGLELSDEVIDKIMAENGKDIESVKSKSTSLEEELSTTKTKLSEYEKTITELQAQSEQSETVKAELEKLQNQIKEQEELQAQIVKDKQLTDNIITAFGDRQFINDYTKNALISEIKAELEKTENAGKGVTDIFESLTKDKEGIFANQATPPPAIGGMGGDPEVAPKVPKIF